MTGGTQVGGAEQVPTALQEVEVGESVALATAE